MALQSTKETIAKWNRTLAKYDAIKQFMCQGQAHLRLNLCDVSESALLISLFDLET